jgi:hypothetical protein
MQNTIVISSEYKTPRRRLFTKYRRLHSWRKVAEEIGVNVYYVHSFVIKGQIPANPKIRKALGIHAQRKPVTINQLLRLPISEMPPEVLRWAFENREEIS